MNKIKIGVAIVSATILTFGAMSYAKAGGFMDVTVNKHDPWTGCHVGGAAGMSGIHNDINGGGLISIDDVGAQGGTFGVLVGCDMLLDNTPNILLGVWADYMWLNSDSSLRILGIPARLDYNSQWAVGGRIGTKITDNVLAYALAGYTELDTSAVRVAGHNISLPKFTGYVVGGGLEVPLGENLLVGVEYRYSDLDSARRYGVNFDPDTQVAMLKVKWKLWGGTEEVIPLK